MLFHGNKSTSQINTWLTLCNPNGSNAYQLKTHNQYKLKTGSKLDTLFTFHGSVQLHVPVVDITDTVRGSGNSLKSHFHSQDT